MGGGRVAFAGGRGSSRAFPWEAIDRSVQHCIFFAQGKCTKGDLCPFSHACPDLGISGGAQRSTDTSSLSHLLQRTEMPTVQESTVNTLSGCGHSGVVDGSALSKMGPSRRHAAFGSIPNAGGPPFVVGPDGATYVIGPDGPVFLDTVVRIADSGRANGAFAVPAKPLTPVERQDSMYHGNDDRGRGSAISRPSEKVATKLDTSGAVQPPEMALSQGGVIALPDGGFITRKRAAELQLRDNLGEKHVRHARQRELGEHDKTRERRSGIQESSATSTGSSRGSIMDRLGPARPAQSTVPTVDTSMGSVRPAQLTHGMAQAADQPSASVGTGRLTTCKAQPAERATGYSGPARLVLGKDVVNDRSVGTEGPTTGRARPAEKTTGYSGLARLVPGRDTAVDRGMGPIRNRPDTLGQLGAKRDDKRQHNSSSVLSMPQALGTARQIPRLDGGRVDRTSVYKKLDTSNTKDPSNSVNFKVPTLEEIKNRKAKADKSIAKTTPVSLQETKKGNGGSPTARNPRFSPQEQRRASSPWASKVQDTKLAPPSPEVALPPVQPQLHAADMDEFSEWL